MPLTLVSNSPQEVMSNMAVLEQHLHNLTQAVLVRLDAAAANTKDFLHVLALSTVHKLPW